MSANTDMAADRLTVYILCKYYMRKKNTNGHVVHYSQKDSKMNLEKKSG